MAKQFTFINARMIDPKEESETSGALTINDGQIEKGMVGLKVKLLIAVECV